MTHKYTSGFVYCDVFQCERTPVWREEDGRLLCEQHRPDTEIDEERIWQSPTNDA